MAQPFLPRNKAYIPVSVNVINIAFLIGIGHRDDELPYYKNPNVPDYEEIVTWK